MVSAQRFVVSHHIFQVFTKLGRAVCSCNHTVLAAVYTSAFLHISDSVIACCHRSGPGHMHQGANQLATCREQVIYRPI